MIQELEHKILNGRIKDKEAEKIKLDYIKTYVNVGNCFNTLSKGTNNYYNMVLFERNMSNKLLYTRCKI